MTARHQILALAQALRIQALQNRSHPTAAAEVRTVVRTPMVADRVTLKAPEATLTRQYGQHARCYSTSKPSFSQRR